KELYLREVADGANPFFLDEQLRDLGIAQLRKSPTGEQDARTAYTREAGGYVFVLFPSGRWGYVVDLLTDDPNARERVLEIAREEGWEVDPHYFDVHGEMIDR